MKASRATVRQMRTLERVEAKLDLVLSLLGYAPQPEPEQVEAVVDEPAVEGAPQPEPEEVEAAVEEPAIEEAPAEEKPKAKSKG